jgi:hypothetical protein
MEVRLKRGGEELKFVAGVPLGEMEEAGRAHMDGLVWGATALLVEKIAQAVFDRVEPFVRLAVEEALDRMREGTSPTPPSTLPKVEPPGGEG